MHQHQGHPVFAMLLAAVTQVPHCPAPAITEPVKLNEIDTQMPWLRLGWVMSVFFMLGVHWVNLGSLSIFDGLRGFVIQLHSTASVHSDDCVSDQFKEQRWCIMVLDLCITLHEMNGLPTPNTLHAMWWSKPRASAICSPMPVVKRKPAFYWQKPQLHPSVQLSEGKRYPVKLGTRLPPLQFWFAIRKRNESHHCEIDFVIYVLIEVDGFSLVNVGSLSNLDRCRHPCASRPRESDSRYSWGSSLRLWQFHPWLSVCVWCFFSSNSKVAKLFGCFYPQRSTWLLKSDGKQQAKSEPRHFKTCPKTLCATPCNSPETLLRESTTKRRGWFHLPSRFEDHQSSHFASNLLQKSCRKLRGRIKNLNEKEFQCFKSRILKMTFVWNTAKKSKTCWCFSLLVGVGTCEDNWEDKLRFTSGWCLAVVSLWYVVIDV